MRYLVLLALLSGCSWQPPEQPARRSTVIDLPKSPPARRAPAPAQQHDSAVIAASIAQQQLGVPYRYGGATPAGFDCSGLVYYAYAQAGLKVPRTTAALWRAARNVERAAVRPGDVLFFDIEGKPSHVGLYLGDNYFIHAPSSGKTVRTASLDEGFYRHRLLRVGRLTH